MILFLILIRNLRERVVVYVKFFMALSFLNKNTIRNGRFEVTVVESLTEQLEKKFKMVLGGLHAL